MVVSVWDVLIGVGWEWWGVEVEAEVVCVGRGAGGGIMFIASKCDFAGWQGGYMVMKFEKIKCFLCS